MRVRLEARRASWTQKVRIDGQVFYLGFGEYPDGRLGEIFITAAKEGTLVRGLLDGVARMASIALQCGASVEDVVESLVVHNFPPEGVVASDMSAVKTCTSILSWVAQEIQNAYGVKS